jgi:hypothetical protein
MAAQVRLNGAGVRELLHSEGVRRMLRARAERAAAAARASAPVASGAYRDSIRVEDATTDRAVGRVVADVPYALVVESKTGNLARSLDAARGA